MIPNHFFGGSLSGYDVYVDRALAPRLERERSRDGSCVNLSAVERNRKKLADSSTMLVFNGERRVVCAPHVFAELQKRIHAVAR